MRSALERSKGLARGPVKAWMSTVAMTFIMAGRAIGLSEITVDQRQVPTVQVQYVQYGRYAVRGERQKLRDD